MPTNLPGEWNKYYEEYQNAKTPENKIKALEQVISHTPKNKATDKIRARFKRKIAELRKESEKKSKAGGRSISVKKEGDAQVSIIGVVNSGKSTFLKKMTRSEPKIAKYPFTTTEPEVGMLEFGGVQIQLVEIPSTLSAEVLSVARTSELVVFLVGEILDGGRQEKKLNEIREKENFENFIFIGSGVTKEKFFRKIWKKLGLMRVFTKEPGKPVGKPMVTEKGTTVEEVARKLHKDFYRYFKYAKISGPSADFKGQRVGSEHQLRDMDIVEFHIRK